MALEFELTDEMKTMVSGVAAVTSALAENIQDLRITSSIGGVEVIDSRNNGRVKFEFACGQSYAEFTVDGVVKNVGTVIINSSYVSQLPKMEIWKCKEMKNKLKVVALEHRYDFELGDAENFLYDPIYGETDIDISSIAHKVSLLSKVIGGFVVRKQDTSLDGAVKISGDSHSIHFEATDNKDAIYGAIDVETAIEKPWTVIIPIGQFESWHNLPFARYHLRIGVDAAFQLTLRCGPIVISHNTLTNLMDSFDAVRDTAEQFSDMGTDGTPAAQGVTFSLQYAPTSLMKKINEATLYAKEDPTLHFTGSDKGLNVVVRTAVVDSDIDMTENLKVVSFGEARLNKSSMALINRINELSSIKIDAMNPDSWLTMRCTKSMVLVSTPDGKFIAITGQVKI